MHTGLVARAFQSLFTAMRPVKACVQCRSGKRRCDRTGDSACSQCTQRDLPCSAAINSFHESQSHTPPQLFARVLAARPDEEVIYLVDLYFQFIHNQPHSLFHEQTFRSSVIAGAVAPPVLFSMIGMSARYKRASESVPQDLHLASFNRATGLPHSRMYGLAGPCTAPKARLH